MKLLVTLEQTFFETSKGEVWTQSGFDYEFWHRYLEGFESIDVMARTRTIHDAPSGWKRSDGPDVKFISLPPYSGPLGYLKSFRELRSVVLKSIGPNDAILLRVPSASSTILTSQLIRSGRPYAVEVVGDPWDVFSSSGVSHPLRPFFRWWFTRSLRRQCLHASLASYVTSKRLQSRYPPNPNAFTTSYSSISLSNDCPFVHPRPPESFTTPLTCITVGSLAQMYKGVDTLIDAMAICMSRGLNLRLSILGDGRYENDLKSQANRLGLADRIEFFGQVTSGSKVIAQLDESDVFVLASRTEGLPRAMIEAMARGLPCIGSNVGGIPELLEESEMVNPDDPLALATKIEAVAMDRNRMSTLSARNLKKSTEYENSNLCIRRTEFYRELRKQTEVWKAMENS